MPLTREEGLANIAANLTRILADRGMNQVALAKRTGIQVMTINRMVRGLHAPNAIDLAVVAEVLDVSVDRLLAPPPVAPISGVDHGISENLSKAS